MATHRGSGLEDYFKTTLEDKLLVKMPEQQSDSLTPATRLLEKKREMAEVETALAAQKEEFQLKMETLQQRRDDLERKERNLKEQLLKFEKFLKENDLKRARALKKTEGEREVCRIKDAEIQQLRAEIAELTEIVQRQKKKIQKFSLFQKFMVDVLEWADEFDEAREVIARYDTLSQTREDLVERERCNQDAIEEERAGLMKLKEEKNNEILGYNNELAHLQTRLEAAQSNAVKWDSEWTRIQTTAAKKTLLLGQLKIATHNLFSLMYKHLQRKIPPQEHEDTLLQLEKLQTFIKDLTEITNDIKRRESAAVPNLQLLAPVNLDLR
jgi:chromosome segregation ATPase